MTRPELICRYCHRTFEADPPDCWEGDGEDIPVCKVCRVPDELPNGLTGKPMFHVTKRPPR